MATQFTAMTWNVENLFPPGAPVGDNKTVQESDYQAKLNYLASRIEEVNPDVLAMQELGGTGPVDERVLIDLQICLNGAYPFRAISHHPDGRGIRVGFLSRLAIEGVNEIDELAQGEVSWVPDWYPDPPIVQMGRGALRILVEPSPGVRIALITLHLKSKLISYPAKGGKTSFDPRDENQRTTGESLALLRRTAEAAAVRCRLNEWMKDSAVQHTIVMGDFNDEPRAATSQIVQGPPDGDVTTPDKLDAVRLYNLVDAIIRRGGEARDKWFLPENQRFSRINSGRHELIDHLLASKSLFGPISDIRKDIWKVKEVGILVDSITGQSVTNNPTARVGKEHPDHAPVFARFDI